MQFEFLQSTFSLEALCRLEKKSRDLGERLTHGPRVQTPCALGAERLFSTAARTAPAAQSAQGARGPDRAFPDSDSAAPGVLRREGSRAQDKALRVFEGQRLRLVPHLGPLFQEKKTLRCSKNSL